MPFIGQMVQDVEYARLHAHRRFLGEAQLFRDSIRRDEPDSEDIVGQPVGVFLHDVDGILAVMLEDSRCISRADPLGLKKDHHLAYVLLVLPGPADHLDPLLPDALYTGEFFNPVVHHIQCLFSKDLHDTAGHHRTDPLDEAAAEIPLDSLDASRPDGSVLLHLELFSIVGVVGPLTRHVNDLARRRGHEVPHHSDQVPFTCHAGASHGIAVLFVRIGDPFDLAAEFGHGVRLLHPRYTDWSRWIFTSHSPAHDDVRLPKGGPSGRHGAGPMVVHGPSQECGRSHAQSTAAADQGKRKPAGRTERTNPAPGGVDRWQPGEQGSEDQVFHNAS